MLRFWSSKLQFWRKSRRKASFFILKASILKEVSQKSFVFELQSFIFEGSLAELLRFSPSNLHFWRKSRRKVSFFILKASILKEVSQKSFVFEFQSYIFEGSLAEKLRFWASKLHFWRKSRRVASFFTFKPSFLKEVSQKSFVFDFQSFIFEGSLAEKLRFWVSKLHFWRKSRRKASFFILKASILKEVSQKSFAFELQSFIFEGSLAEMLRFWSSNLHFWRKSRRKASFLIFKASFLKEVSHKSFVLELESCNFEGSLAELLRFSSWKLQFWRKSRRKASFLSFKASILKEVSQKSFEFQFDWQPNWINWISNQLTTNSFESQINWQPTHLNLEPLDNQIAWISNQLTTMTWSSIQQTTKIIWSTHQLTTKSLEAQINWQPTHLNLKTIDNELIWISNHLTAKSLESHFTWIWHQLTFEPFALHTPSSYRFLIFGNFRHRLVR